MRRVTLCLMFLQKTFSSTTDEILICKCVPAHSITSHAAFDNLRCTLNKTSSPDLLSGTQMRGYHIFEMAYTRTSPQPLPDQFSAHALQRNCQVAHLRQQCHDYSSATTTAVPRLQQCHDYSSATTTAVSRLQQYHNYSSATTTVVSRLQLQQYHDYSSATTTPVSRLQQCHDYSSVTTTAVSQLKICVFFRRKF
jgi:hypothetical protein